MMKESRENSHFNLELPSKNLRQSLISTCRIQNDKQVGNIIATEAMVASQVAEDVARIFYEHFLQGSPLGKSLYTAREPALNGWDAKNIVSLFYSLYGNPFFHLKEAKSEGGV